MGRGRQKAKQTKVARALKYYSPETDYERLQRELQGGSGLVPDHSDDTDDADDEYSDESDDDGGWSSAGSR